MNKLFQIKKRVIIFILTLFLCVATSAQQNTSFTGVIKCQSGTGAIPYATVALLNTTDSLLVAGAISNFEGEFQINTAVKADDYLLRVSHVGYQDAFSVVNAASQPLTIHLQQIAFEMSEFVVMGERITARVEKNKTTFFMNQKIAEASHNGMDALKHLPGIQIDFMQNLSLEGNQNIVILVDGRERDLNYVRQLNVTNIDLVEIMNVPGVEYDGETGGVINIVLKERESGFSGHVYADIPTTPTEVYLFPTYNLQYGLKRFNFFTSYNGEISRLEIIESSHRSFQKEEGETQIISQQLLSQNDWSHRFNYGVDFYINKKNQLNFYGFYNPWSQTRDGQVFLQALENNGEETRWKAEKKDTDNNHRIFSSLYYRHIFEADKVLSIDISHYNLQSKKATAFSLFDASQGSPPELANRTNPLHNTFFLKTDFTTPLAGGFSLQTGFKGTIRRLEDKLSEEFKYHENTLAAYVKTAFTTGKIFSEAGVRVEDSYSTLKEGFSNKALDWLPHLSAQYRFSTRQSIRLSYQRSVHRPGLYQLNPGIWSNDPYSTYSGNPGLKPEYRDFLAVEYATRPGEHFVSTQLFYRNSSQVLNPLTFVNGKNIFETRMQNMGEMAMYGLRLAGALKISPSIALNPFVRIFEVQTSPNAYAREHGIAPIRETAWEGGLSAIVSLPRNMSVSLIGQYNSPLSHLQGSTFSDVLYFASFDKHFDKGFMLGVTSGLPFSRSFLYHGETTPGHNFHVHSEGNIIMSTFPVWFKLSYRFQSGKKINTIQREKENIEHAPTRGFRST